MLIDTHCHLNMIVKEAFDKKLTEKQIELAKFYIDNAYENNVKRIINVGTSLIESLNCIELAKKFKPVFATVGIHPNDLKNNWKTELNDLKKLLKTEEKIVGIGECGLDFHYPEYNKQQQKDAFKAQIELSLENNIGLVVHTRQAPQETLEVLNEFKGQIKKGIIHCFSEDLDFAKEVIKMKFAIGLGGTITYPKNDKLREVAKKVKLSDIVLETDAPFLAPQSIRGQQNTPKEIATIARFLAEIRKEELETIEKTTTDRAKFIFNLND